MKELIKELNPVYIPKMRNLLLLVFLILFAFLFSTYSGMRGIHPLDQPIVFDGAYRIFSGQSIYKDFQAPVGPVTFFLQALLFWIFGVSWNIMIATAALCNVVAAILVVRIVGIFTGFSKLYVYLAGFLTAVWFYPPFGTVYFEQTALLFALVAIWGILESSVAERIPVKRILIGIAGASIALGILSKQNIGLFTLLPILFVFLMTWENNREFVYSIAIFLGGFLIPIIVFIVYLYSNQAFDLFRFYVLDIPGEIGLRRIFNISRIIQRYSNAMLMSVFSILLIIMNLAIINFRRFAKYPRKAIFAAAISISLIITQQLSLLSARNQAENYYGFMGLILGLSFAFFQPLVIPLVNWYRKLINKAPTIKSTEKFINFYKLGVLVLSALIFLVGVQISSSRVVHDFFSKANFKEALDIPGMEWVRWGPQIIQGQIIEAKDIENLYQYLLDSDVDFYIFPEYSFFYGIIGVPSPPPLLWFHKGLTFNDTNRFSIDETIVEGLTNNYPIVVMSSVGTPGTEHLLDNFPAFKNAVAEDYLPINKFGIFDVYERKSPEN